MDTSDYPSVPNLSQLHARLAANSRHVEAVMNSQIDGIEQLFTATTAQDWPAVAEASRYLAGLEPDRVGVDVIREARYVFEELSHGIEGHDTEGHGAESHGAEASKKQPKHLASLLIACRDARKKIS